MNYEKTSFYSQRNSGLSKGLSFIGQNTLCIFVVHKPFIACFRVMLLLPTPRVVTLIIVTVATLLLSGFLSKILNKYAPILVGR